MAFKAFKRRFKRVIEPHATEDDFGTPLDNALEQVDHLIKNEQPGRHPNQTVQETKIRTPAVPIHVTIEDLSRVEAIYTHPPAMVESRTLLHSQYNQKDKNIFLAHEVVHPEDAGEDDRITIECNDNANISGVSHSTEAVAIIELTMTESQLQRSGVLARFLESPAYLPGGGLKIKFPHVPRFAWDMAKRYLKIGPDRFQQTDIITFVNNELTVANRGIAIVRLFALAYDLDLMTLMDMAFRALLDIEVMVIEPSNVMALARYIFGGTDVIDPIELLRKWVTRWIECYRDELAQSQQWKGIIDRSVPELCEIWTKIQVTVKMAEVIPETKRLINESEVTLNLFKALNTKSVQVGKTNDNDGPSQAPNTQPSTPSKSTQTTPRMPTSPSRRKFIQVPRIEPLRETLEDQAANKSSDRSEIIATPEEDGSSNHDVKGKGRVSDYTNEAEVPSRSDIKGKGRAIGYTDEAEVQSSEDAEDKSLALANTGDDEAFLSVMDGATETKEPKSAFSDTSTSSLDTNKEKTRRRSSITLPSVLKEVSEAVRKQIRPDKHGKAKEVAAGQDDVSEVTDLGSSKERTSAEASVNPSEYELPASLYLLPATRYEPPTIQRQLSTTHNQHEPSTGLTNSNSEPLLLPSQGFGEPFIFNPGYDQGEDSPGPSFDSSHQTGHSRTISPFAEPEISDDRHASMDTGPREDTFRGASPDIPDIPSDVVGSRHTSLATSSYYDANSRRVSQSTGSHYEEDAPVPPPRGVILTAEALAPDSDNWPLASQSLDPLPTEREELPMSPEAMQREHLNTRIQSARSVEFTTMGTHRPGMGGIVAPTSEHSLPVGDISDTKAREVLGFGSSAAASPAQPKKLRKRFLGS